MKRFFRFRLATVLLMTIVAGAVVGWSFKWNKSWEIQEITNKRTWGESKQYNYSYSATCTVSRGWPLPFQNERYLLPTTPVMERGTYTAEIYGQEFNGTESDWAEEIPWQYGFFALDVGSALLLAGMAGVLWEVVSRRLSAKVTKQAIRPVA